MERRDKIASVWKLYKYNILKCFCVLSFAVKYENIFRIVLPHNLMYVTEPNYTA